MSPAVRHEAHRWAERGYFNKSLDISRQLPDDSLTIQDMRLRYDNFVQLGATDSLFFWGDQILKRDPYNTSLILDYTPRLNTGKEGMTFPKKVIDICRRYRERDSTHILVNRQLAEEKDVNELTYDIGMCHFTLRQLDKAEECLRKFLDATQNKEYNDNIKRMRQNAEQTLRMMMW